MTTEHVTAQQAFNQLVKLRDDAGTNIHERLKLADRLLSDHLWVQAKTGGGGDESKAIDKLEEEAFGDTALSLPELLEVFKGIPQLSSWKANKFNLRKMHQEFKNRQRKGKPATPSAPPRIPTTTEEKLRAALTEKAALLRENSDLKREVRRLTQAVKNLQAALGNLQIPA